MNVVVLMGRLTRDPELKGTETKLCNYSLAVDRQGEGTDYPQIVAFGKSAEFAHKYFKKGMRVGVTGRIQTGSYTNSEGKKIYTTNVVADRQYFADAKKDEFVPADEADLPFNE